VPGSGGTLRLRVHELLPADPARSAEAHVRFIGPSEVIDLLRAGDGDSWMELAGGRAATIASLGVRQRVPGEVTIAPVAGDRSAPGVRAAQSVAQVDAVVRLGVDAMQGGWRYRTQPIGPGQVMTLTTGRYVARALVLTLTVSNVRHAE
jgi:hypothetical protein